MQDRRFQAAWHHLNSATVDLIHASSAHDAQPPRRVREDLAHALSQAKLATLKIQEILADSDIQ